MLMQWHYFTLLRLSNIPLYMCTFIYLSLSKSLSLYLFSVSSSVSGHSGCFQILAIVKSTAVNIPVHLYFEL